MFQQVRKAGKRNARSRVQGMFVRHGLRVPPPRVSCFHYGLRSRIFDTSPRFFPSPHAALEPVSKRRIQREWLHAEVSVGCSRDGIDLLCPDLVAASGIDPAKCRVAKSGQRASFACRGEAKGNVKLLL